MRFLFVDAITSIGEGAISGYRHFPVTDPMQYSPHVGPAQVASGAMCEAVGQLASWYCLKQNKFQSRPVFLFADSIDVLKPVYVGARVDLRAEIHSLEDDAFRFSGEALVDGEVCQRINDCGGMFMPLANLEDPDVAAARFESLCSGGLVLDGAAGSPYPFANLVGEILDHDEGRKIHARRTFNASEPFYADHFPRFPVTPIVMLNEMIGQATVRMLGLSRDTALRPLAISRIKIRSFVAPGDSCETVVTSPGIRTVGSRKLLDATAELIKGGKRILRGEYFYEVTE
jgi:3-hydroxymyristoyl/3-hydroxydecanoyl-(acyl carrier protein) dehydratase